jgi:hypothetical protein
MKSKIKNKAKEKFKKLKFKEENHIYSVDDKKIPSTSSLIKQFYKDFDSEKVSSFVAKKEGVSQQEVLDKWTEINLEAINRGTKVHEFAEDYCNGLDVKPFCVQSQAVVDFWDSLPAYYELVFVELQMCNEEYWYAGTTDFVLLDKRDGSLVIGDYKTNKDLFKSYNNMLPPFDLLKDNPYNHYQIQFSYYQILLEQLGYRISNRLLVWLKHDGGYETYNTSNFSNVLKMTFDDKWRNNTESAEYVF